MAEVLHQTRGQLDAARHLLSKHGLSLELPALPPLQRLDAYELDQSLREEKKITADLQRALESKSFEVKSLQNQVKMLRLELSETVANSKDRLSQLQDEMKQLEVCPHMLLYSILTLYCLPSFAHFYLFPFLSFFLSLYVLCICM